MTSTLKFDRWQNTSGETIADVSSGGFPGRNLLYNGAMQVAQRGTSSTGITGSGYFTADRWQQTTVSMGTWTQTVEADGPTGSGFTKSLKIECTTADGSPAASDYINFRQRLEGQDLQALKKGTSGAESLTLSFWVKSNVTGTYTIEIRDWDNARHIAKSYTVDSSGVWEKKTITFDGDTSGVLDNDNALSLWVAFFLGAGSDFTSGSLATSWAAVNNANAAVGQVNVAASTSNYWQVTGVQLEAGTVATPFEHKAYGVELAECQRYYWRTNYSNTNSEIGRGQASSTTNLRVWLPLPTSMRQSPSSVEALNLQVFTYAGTPKGTTNSPVILANSDMSILKIHVTSSSLTADSMYELRVSSSGANSGYLAASAEL